MPERPWFARGAAHGALQLQDETQNRRPGDESLVPIRHLAETGLRTPASRLPYLDQIQASFGRHDVSGVRAHRDDSAAAITQAIGAKAYASGNDVVFGQGTSLYTAAHEAAHIIQQRRGVSLSTSGIGTAGDAYEQQADAVARRVVSGQSAEPLLAGSPGHAPESIAPDQHGLVGRTPSVSATTPAGGAPLQMEWETVRTKRRTALRVGDQVAASGYARWNQKQRLAAGVMIDADFDHTLENGAYVRARRWISGRYRGPAWYRKAGGYREGYIKVDAVDRLAHNLYKTGDKFFGLADPPVEKKNQIRYGYSTQIGMSHPQYSEDDQQNAADFVNQLGPNGDPISKRDKEMFRSYQNNPFWQNKPEKKTGDTTDDDEYEARRNGQAGIGVARASKVALAEAVRTNPNTTIRFLLDGLNLEDIATKKTGTENGVKHHGQSFTAHELRFVYRHRNELFKDRVKFYLDGIEVPAPWVSDPDLWARYQPKHTYT